MNIKVSYVTISKWIEIFNKYLKSITYQLIKSLYLDDYDKLHVDKTVIKINTQKY